MGEWLMDSKEGPQFKDLWDLLKSYDEDGDVVLVAGLDVTLPEYEKQEDYVHRALNFMSSFLNKKLKRYGLLSFSNFKDSHKDLADECLKRFKKPPKMVLIAEYERMTRKLKFAFVPTAYYFLSLF